MANIKSAAKRIKQTKRNAERNRYVRSTMRTAVKKVRGAVESGEGAVEALKDAITTIQKTASKGVIHKKQAARRVSRLTKLVNKAAK